MALKRVEKLQVLSAQEKYSAYVLSDTMRQTSDDLTKFCRLYVITHDQNYLNDYNEILLIRNGRSARPLRYDQIYWDLVLDPKAARPRPYGPVISLRQMEIDHGLSAKEFALLQESERNSNQLAQYELQAMNAVQGRYLDPATGQYTIKRSPNQEWAIEMVFGQEYMVKKAQIMAPLQIFLETLDDRTTRKNDKFNKESVQIIFLAIGLSMLSTVLMLISILKALSSLSKVHQENEVLLLNILPEAIAERLKAGEEPIADEIPHASVLFADIVGFTEMTHRLGAKETVALLNSLFAEFDILTEEFGVEKVKTIGDNYMAVAGVSIPEENHAIRLAEFALALQQKIKFYGQVNHVNLQLRIGMTSGELIAGVIGHKKFIYDIWGDVVNIASRMESTGEPGKIQVAEKMANILEEKFILEPREAIEVKGRGLMQTFFLIGKKDEKFS
jgi:class 3 adenylate cyclase